MCHARHRKFVEVMSMDINGNQRQEAERARQRIRELLQQMPLENLAFIEQFVLFMHQHGQLVVTVSEQKGQVPYLYPSIPVPASSLDSWSKLLDKGYEGDALADTEAVYDDV
jgi:hypothetical protein